MKEWIKKKKDRILEIIKVEGMLSFLKRPHNIARRLLNIYLLKDRIKKMNQNYTLDTLFNFVHEAYSGLIKTKQIKYEIIELLKVIKEKKPKFLLEIGTANGGTLFLLTRVADTSATLISIDLPGGPYGGGYTFTKIPLYKGFALPNQNIHLIRENSHSKDTVNKMLEILGKNKLDFLLIDGDHTYDGVKKDFELYSPLVAKNGIIAFHDIVVHPPEMNVNINTLWLELKQKYEYVELVEDWGQLMAGIGFIIV